MEIGRCDPESSELAGPNLGFQSTQPMLLDDPLCEGRLRSGPELQADYVQSPYQHTDLPAAMNAFTSLPDNADTASTCRRQGPDPLDRFLADHFETLGPSALFTEQQDWEDDEQSQDQSSSSMARSTASSLYGPTSWSSCSVLQAEDFGSSKPEVAPPMRMSLSESTIPRNFRYASSDICMEDIGLPMAEPLQRPPVELSTAPITSHPRAFPPAPPPTSSLTSASNTRPETRASQRCRLNGHDQRLYRRPYKQALRQTARQSQSLSPCAGADQQMLTDNSTMGNTATGGDYFSELGSNFQDLCPDLDWLSQFGLAALNSSSMDLVNLGPTTGATPDLSQNSSIWPRSTFDPGIKIAPSIGQASPPMLTNFPSFETTNFPLPTSLSVMRPRFDSLDVPRPSHTRRKSDPTPSSSKTLSNGVPMNKSLSSPTFVPRRRQPPCRPAAPTTAQKLTTKAIGPDIPSIQLTPSPRGRRQGPMQEDKKVKARKTRNDRSMCIGCKISKVSCHIPPGSHTCVKCLKITPDSRLPYVCTKAYFLDIVMSGTTNYISQYSINHIRRDRFHRKSIALPPVLDFQDFLPSLDLLSQKYDIGVSQGELPLFVLDLRGCHSYLEGLLPGLKTSSQSFRGFIDSQLNKSDKWGKCLKDSRPFQDPLKALVVWNNMPSRVDYTLVSKSSGDVRLLDPDDQGDEQTLFVAAQLSRIINRKLEVSAYTTLQQCLNANSPPAMDLLTNLGRLLLSLRWRLSWWNVFGLGIAIPSNPNAAHRAREVFMERVQSLCRILYFYYCSMVRRLPTYTDFSKLRGRITTYPDTQGKIWEDFPQDESVKGFEAWMKEGDGKIQEAGTSAQLRSIGLLPLTSFFG